LHYTAGLSIKAQATLLELLEAQGLPLLCVTMAVKEDAHRKLGEVLATAVKVSHGAVCFLPASKLTGQRGRGQ
jgi:hypothetical protein